MKKPEPINKQVVCSVCGLDWQKHGERPTLENCIELLKAELVKRPTLLQHAFHSIPPMTSVTHAYSGIPAKGDDVGKIQ